MKHLASALALSLSLGACADVSSILAPVQHRRSRALGDDLCTNQNTEVYTDCSSGSGLTAGSPVFGISLPGMTPEYCFNPQPGNDDDGDGIATDCEEAMAAAFAPLLRMSSDDRDYVAGQGLVGGEYYYAVGKYLVAGEQRVRIVYMPAYYRDEGSVDQAFDSHNGDSEFITVDIGRHPNITDWWISKQVFMSAHCGATNGNACGWYAASTWSGSGAAWADGRPYGAPVVWVSQDKHANYHSYEQCTWSADGVDYCGDEDLTVRFPVTAGFNIGSWQHQLVNEVAARRPSNRGIGNSTELFWTSFNRNFFGWQGLNNGSGATAYTTILGDMGFIPPGFFVSGGSLIPDDCPPYKDVC